MDPRSRCMGLWEHADDAHAEPSRSDTTRSDTTRSGPSRSGPAHHRAPGYRVTPEYPVAALRAGESGTVLLRVAVGIGGLPGEIDFARRSGSRELDNAARDAVKQWRFEPARRNGKPVASVVEIPVDFAPPR